MTGWHVISVVFFLFNFFFFNRKTVPIRAFCHDRVSEVLLSDYRELEMSTYGTLVSVQWSRLSIFKEVTRLVWWLMARVFLAETKSNILKIH